MRIRKITFHLIIFLLLSSLTLPAIACPPPDCGSCCHWVPTGPEPEDGYCELNVGAECGDCCACGGECYTCSSCSCISDESKCADCMTCIAGDCFDVQCAVLLADECQRCNETTGECESTCADCMTCIVGDCVDIQCAVLGECEQCNETTGLCESTCDADECCQSNTCVNKCRTGIGSFCTWTNPPVLDPLCTYLHEGTRQCLNPGYSCDWRVVDGPTQNDICASCAPGCPLNSEHCVKLEPIVCEDSLTPLPPFNDCTCSGTPSLVVYQYVGTRDVCP